MGWENGYDDGQDDYEGDTSYEGMQDYGQFDMEPISQGEEVEYGMQEVDEAAMWLEEQGSSLEVEEKEAQETSEAIAVAGISGSNEEAGFGMATARDLQLQRFKHMEPTIQQSVVDMIMQPDLFAVKNENKDISVKSVRAGIESFGSVIGGDPKDFAIELQKGIPEGVKASTYGMDIRTSYSMVTLTAEAKLEKGPGQSLIGDSFTEEQQQEKDEDLIKATELLKKYTEYYIPEATKESHIYERKQKEVSSAILDRLLNQSTEGKGVVVYDKKTGLQATDQDGNPIFSSAATPLPGELGVRGLIMDAAEGGISGSPHTRLSYAAMFPSDKDLHTDPETGKVVDEYQASVWKGSEAGQYTPAQLAMLAPSLKKTFFNPKEFTKEGSQELMTQMNEDMKFIKNTFAKEALTTSDENWGNYYRSSKQIDRFKDDETSNAYNEAAILDLDMTKSKSSGKSMEGLTNRRERFLSGVEGENYQDETEIASGMTLRGSDRGGMYDNTGLSERDTYLEDPDAYEGDVVFKEQKTLEEISEEAEKVPQTDREAYLARIEALNPPEQGSKEWKDLHEGRVTGSIISTLLNKRGTGPATLANAMIRKESGKELLDNFHMKQGRENEEFLKKAFEKESGLVVEEAYFETTGDSYGASPDGMVFDKSGKSQGVLELKYLSSDENMDKALKKYTNQAQWEMMNTGEKKAHFFTVNRETEEFDYEIIHEDKELQKKLRKAADKALEIKSTREEEMKRRVKDSSVEQAKENVKANSKGMTYDSSSAKSDDRVYGAISEDDTIAEVFDSVESKNVESEVGGKEGKAPELVGPVLPPDSIEEAQRQEKMKKAAAEELRAVEEATKAEEWETDVKELNATVTEDAAEAKKKNAQAADDLAASFKKLEDATGDLIGIIAKAGTESVDTLIGIEKQATKFGVSAESMYGTIMAMGTKANITPEETNRMFEGMSGFLTDIADPTQGIQKFTNAQATFGAAGMSLPSYSSLLNMDVLEFGDILKTQMESKGASNASQKQKRAALEVMNAESLLMAEGVKDELFSGAVMPFPSDIARQEHRGVMESYQLELEGRKAVVESLGWASEITGVEASTIASEAEKFMTNKGGYLLKRVLGMKDSWTGGMEAAEAPKQNIIEMREAYEEAQRSKGKVIYATDKEVKPAAEILREEKLKIKEEKGQVDTKAKGGIDADIKSLDVLPEEGDVDGTLPVMEIGEDGYWRKMKSIEKAPTYHKEDDKMDDDQASIEVNNYLSQDLIKTEIKKNGIAFYSDTRNTEYLGTG